MCPDLAHTGMARHARVVLAEGERLLRHLDTTVQRFERLTGAPPELVDARRDDGRPASGQ